MIASLTGSLQSVGSDHAVIDVGGVGYLVTASARTLALIGPAGGDIRLLTEMQVSEDAIRLFGFATAGERDWYRLLVSVQGVGARVALAILGILSPEELATAVARADKAMVARASGVGPKLAQRIVNELKDKVGALPAGTGASLSPAGAAHAAGPASAATDALSALANLGFRPAEAARAVSAAEAEVGPDATLDHLVRAALRHAAR